MAVEFGKRQSRDNDGPEAAGSPGGSGAPAHQGSPPGSPNVSLQDGLRFAAELAAAALIGFGVILWVAAHWDDIGRLARFAIVGGALAASIVVALFNAARTPGLILSFLATGGLLALIGQTYQTGADPWQLFALWAAIGIPWALAARSDALWVVWSIVGNLAVTLWLATFARVGWWSLDAGVTFAGWMISLAMAAAFSPVSPLRPWLGETRWAFRLATVLAVVQLTQSGLAALFTGSDVSVLYWLSLLILGALAGALVSLPRLDLPLLALLGLALDTMLISGLARALFTSRGDLTLSFLMVGLMGAGLVAGTGALILKLARDRAGGGPDLGVLSGREWPVILMTGIGAVLTALPLGGFLGLFLGAFLVKGAGAYIIGAMLLAGALVALRTNAQTSFVHQLAAIALTLGFGLIAFALFRDAPSHVTFVSGMLAFLAAGLAVAVGRSWTAGLLGAAAAFFAAAFLNGLMFAVPGPHAVPPTMRSLGWTLVLAAGAAWYAWSANLSTSRRIASPLAAVDRTTFDRALAGAMLAGLLGIMASAGPTFLLSGALGGFGPRGHLSLGLTPQLSAAGFLSAALALTGCGLLLLPRPTFQTALGVGAGAIVVLLSAIMPSLGAPVLVVAVALATGRRALGVGALIAAMWVVGSFYYWLGWPLAEKAALMFAAGITLGILCLVAGLRRPPFRLADGPPAPALLARGLIILGAVATAALAAQSITTNEKIIATGRQIFVALAPVDPRSLIQGDYMRLNFAVPQERRPRHEGSILGQRRWAVADLDDRGVATIDKVTDAPPETITSGQIVLPLRYKNRRWIVSTDAWYFKEGTAEKWQKARFGVFRVSGDGTALLVGMADKDLAVIQ
ncbi:MAG: GDYXXLXY domain-containing protein [Hyphomicrobiaceae bacterium]